MHIIHGFDIRLTPVNFSVQIMILFRQLAEMRIAFPKLMQRLCAVWKFFGEFMGGMGHWYSPVLMINIERF